MVLKRLDELTASELRIELKRAGIQGKYVKGQAIMRLTTHLIDISEDPLSFEFDPEMPIEADATDVNGEGVYEVTNDLPEVVSSAETAGGTAASVSGLVNSISGASSSQSVPVTTTSTPFVTSTSSASITTSTVTISSASGSIPSQQSQTYPPNAGFAMYNPYNPVQYPGMQGGNFTPQYPGVSPTTAGSWAQGVPGLSPSGAAPPYPAMWTPWGGWTPLAQAQAAPAPAVTTSANVASGTPFVLNNAMADFTGACPPPARSSDTKSTKITSGQYDSGRREVKERQNWPQVMVDHILNPEPVDYDEMDWAGLTAGMTGKILAEMDPGSMDVATVNKLKHLNRLANYGMKTPMKSILNFNAVLFRAVENRALSL